MSQAIKAIPFLILIEKVIRALPLSTAMLSLSLLTVRFFLLDQIWRFQPFPSLFAFQVGSKERVGKWNQTKGQIGLPSHSIS